MASEPREKVVGGGDGGRGRRTDRSRLYSPGAGIPNVPRDACASAGFCMPFEEEAHVTYLEPVGLAYTFNTPSSGVLTL